MKMVRSIFGGDPRMSHYSGSVRYKISANETEREATARRKSEYQTLKDAGIRTRYFQYREGDAKGKANAKKLAEAEAARVKKLTGIILDVSEGFFL